ncbi:predicted protein [Naegleria gruberi]|uniref:Predicted protein n=1 Tax=Naegleria gruberi TaxID=5762 RepID=D2W1R4_NAEGR|nr:uncharacterized protein NAEGRDRAFT_75348 [Naegleria gruberi]EFC37012.1 predicted protein [Naegleria gruberi]|eukprot:XP_002669756.1 predicted protein [Naegleria gruberi strain NEG-M]
MFFGKSLLIVVLVAILGVIACNVVSAEEPVFTCFGLKSTDKGVCSRRGKCVGNNKCECFAPELSEPKRCRATGLKKPKKEEVFTCYGKKSTDKNVCYGRGRCVGNNKCKCYNRDKSAACAPDREHSDLRRKLKDLSLKRKQNKTQNKVRKPVYTKKSVKK